MESLPLELLDRVYGLLNLIDRCALSSVNSQYRSLLVPYLFKSLTFNCFENNSGIVHLVKKHGQCVKSLNFDLQLNPNPSDDTASDLESLQDNNVMSQTTLDLLSCKGLVNAKTLTINFLPYQDFDSDGFHGYGLGGSIYINSEIEIAEDVEQAEETFSWRAAMNQTMKALTRNESSKHIAFRDLPPVATSTYESKAWQQWLGKLESLDIELWAGDNGAGWHSNTTEGYKDFVVSMKEFFYDQLSSAKRLRFVAHEKSFVGCEGHNSHCPIPLGPDSAPRVEQLELENCMIDPGLSSFLENLSGHLKSLRLVECYSAGWDDKGVQAINPISWAQFFSAIEASNTHLADLTIVNDPLRFEYLYDSSIGLDVHLRRFMYVRLDDKYGFTGPLEELDLESYEKGDDERSFDSLMRMVTRNRTSVTTC